MNNYYTYKPNKKESNSSESIAKIVWTSRQNLENFITRGYAKDERTIKLTYLIIEKLWQ